jgi:hypothetical protein
MRSRRQLSIGLCSVLILAAPCIPAQADNAPPVTQRYRLEEHGGGLGVFVDETIVILSVGKPDAQTWVLERWRRDRNWCGQKSADGKCLAGDVTVHEWATSSDCAELNWIIEGLGDLKETGREKPVLEATDTPLITLEFAPFDADGESQRVMREYAGPLAGWWQNWEGQIKRCWTATPPRLDGYSLKPRLAAPGPASE